MAASPLPTPEIAVEAQGAEVISGGALDASFHPNADGDVTAIAVRSDGKILISGGFYTLFPNGTGDHFTRPFLARLNVTRP